jgi:hypothetical protein
VKHSVYQQEGSMCKKKRQSGHGAGPVSFGSVTVPARWRYSYLEGPELPGNGGFGKEFKLVVTLAVADRKKLLNLKKGSWTTVTADPFREMPVYLGDVEYNDGATRVSLIFTKMPPTVLN